MYVLYSSKLYTFKLHTSQSYQLHLLELMDFQS